MGRRKFTPVSQTIHDEYFRRPHLHKHNLDVKPPKKGRERTSMRSLVPQTTMHDYAMLLNPLNAKNFIEAFGNRIDAAPTYQPPAEFQTVVQRYNETYPMFSTSKGMKPETAYYIMKIEEETNHQVNMGDYFVTDNKRIPSAPRMRKSLASLVEEEHNNVAAGNLALQTQMNTLYDEAMRLATVQASPIFSGQPIPRQANTGISSSVSAQSSRQGSPSPVVALPPPPASPGDSDRDRSPSQGRRVSASPDFQYRTIPR